MDTEIVDNTQGRGFDWDAMRERVARANEILRGMSETTPEDIERVWALRAAKLARVPAAGDAGELVDLVLVRLGRETYGLDAHYVWDIKPLEEITPVPRVPKWVEGVVNRRGRIYSVVNLQRFFNLPAAESSKTPFLIVVETLEMEVALMADDVLSIEAIPAARIEEATGIVRGLPSEYVQGVAQYENSAGGESSLVVVLDLPAMLADERLVIHEEVL
jgi:purine-binding chemotaxis protein CheW